MKNTTLHLILILFTLQTVSAVTWWDDNYQNRRQINVSVGANTPYNNYNGYSVQFFTDTTGELFLDNGYDLRIVYWNGSDNTELDRDVYDVSTSNTEIWFMIQANISGSGYDENYYLYYDYSSAGSPPSNKSNVYLHYNNWSSDRLSEYDIGRQDDWHGRGAYSDFSYSATDDRVEFDTGDNAAGGLRLTNFGERDVYIEQRAMYTSSYKDDVTHGFMVRYSGDGTSSNNWYGYVQADSTCRSDNKYRNTAFQKDRRRNNGVASESPVRSAWPCGGSYFRLAQATWGSNPTQNKGWFDQSPRKPATATLEYDDPDDHENAGDVVWQASQSQGAMTDFLVRRYTEPEPSITLSSEKDLDIEDPTVTLDTPSADYNTSLVNITLNFTVTDDQATFLECSLYVNETLNQTYSSVQNNTLTTFNFTDLDDAVYAWTVNCSDDSGNLDAPAARIFTVDTTGSLSVTRITPSDPTSTNIGNTFYLAGTVSCAGDTTADSESCGAVNVTGVYYPGAGGEPTIAITDSTLGMTLVSVSNLAECGIMAEGDSCSFNITVEATASGGYEVEIEADSNKSGVVSAESSHSTVTVAGAAIAISLTAPGSDPSVYQQESFNLTCEASCSGVCTNVVVYPYYCDGTSCNPDTYLTNATTDLTANQSNASLGSVSDGTPEDYTFLITAFENDSYDVSCRATSDNGNPIDPTGQAVTVLSAAPTLASISNISSPVKGGNVVTLNATGVADPNNDLLQFYCSNSPTPNATNKVTCVDGNFENIVSPYNTSCNFITETDTTSHTIYCRTYDGSYYSAVASANYTTDSTPPSTYVNNIAADTDATYYDIVNDGVTDIAVDGEANMDCRWGYADRIYSELTNDCTISGTQAVCSPTPSQGTGTNYYVSCIDSLGNPQNTSQNIDISALVIDWTAPNTTDSSVEAVQVAPYTVTITEDDNLYGISSINTTYCVDVASPYNCTPTLDIGDASIEFTTRGVNVLRYSSSDPAGNIQTTVNSTININQLPNLTSAADDASSVRGGTNVSISTVVSDPDAQTLTLFVCQTASVTSAGCTSAYCSATSTSNPGCSFTSSTAIGMHIWYAYIYDSLNESSPDAKTGNYTVVSPEPVFVVSPDNETYYNTTTVWANISLLENATWAGYCLDSCVANQTMSGSQTSWYYQMTALAGGSHSIIFYATISGVTANSSTVTFTVDTTPPAYVEYNNTPVSPTSGESVTCYSRWTDDLQLASAIIEENATGTFRNHTTSMSGNDSWGNYTISSSDLLSGTVQCRVYAGDSVGNLNITPAWTFTVTDVTPPTIANITYSPDTADGIDPNSLMVVTAVIVDASGVSEAVLQYKQTSAVTWTNVTMYNMTEDVNDTYEGFFVPNTAGNWSFRIVAVDIANNTHTSGSTVLEVEYDHTWTRTPVDLGQIGGTLAGSVTLGTLIVNNTGDFTLTFDLDFDRPTWISVNVTEPFDLAAKAVKYIQVNSTTPDIEGEFPMQITVNATTEGAVPDSLTTDVTLVALTDGPYFYVTIDTYSSSVTQGESGISLLATVKNIGNQDASGVWFSWVLPSGWSSDYELNKSVGFLGVGESAKNAITVNIGSSAATGTKSLLAIAGSLENVTRNVSKSVSVSQGAGGGGGGGGGGGSIAKPKKYRPQPKSYSLSVDVPAVVETLRDTIQNVILNITNTGTGNLTQIYITSSDFLIESDPNWFLRIEPGEMKSSILRVNVSSTTTSGDYTVNVLVDTLEVQRSVSFTLRVHEVSEEFAMGGIERAGEDILAMQGAGFKTILVGDLLRKASKVYNELKYGEASRLADMIHERMTDSFRINNLIDKARKRISESESVGKDVDKARELLRLAETAFKQEDYIIAEKYAQDTLRAKLGTLESISRQGIGVEGIVLPSVIRWVDILKWLSILALALFAFSIALGLGYMRAKPMLNSRKIKGLEKEQKVIENLINEIDRKYYIDKSISGKDYRQTKEEYENKRAKVKQTIASLESKIKGKKKPNNNSLQELNKK